MEPLARRAISRLTGIEFIETGMLASEDIEGFALSPDAIYEEGGKVIGGLEIKCPDSKKHIEYLINNQLPKEYADQVKAPFLMSEDVQWWYFASFDDRNYELPVFLLKITRDNFKEIDADQEKLKTFINRVNEKHAELTF